MKRNNIEAELVNLLNKKSHRGFQILYNQYYPVLVSFAINYIDSQETAKDLVQDVFAGLWRSNAFFSTFSGIKSFLYSSVKNAALNYIKHEKAELRYRNSLPPEGFSDETDDLKIIEEEAYRFIYSVIIQMPKRCRQIFELHLEGKSNEEIALTLEISVHTVKTQKSRAMASLREKANNHYFYFLLIFLLS